MSLALEISKVEMATEKEQIAHALKSSMKEFQPPLQEFVWPCDEEVSETASDKTDETTSSSCPTVTDGTRDANNDVADVNSSSEKSAPSVLHVIRPTNKPELKSILTSLGEVAYTQLSDRWGFETSHGHYFLANFD